MLLKRVLLSTGLVILVCAVAQASSITDPDMGIDAGSLSDPITTGTTFSPTNGGGTFGFFNPLSSFITRLVFQVSIATGLEQGTINTAFNCQQSNPFFLGCFINYVPTTGLLSIGFSGVNPPNQFGQKEGIPPLLPGCLSNPDAPGCRDVGHFIITLNDNFALTGNSGGWSQTANPVLFPTSQITFGVAEITGDPTPEPSTAVLIVTAFLCMVGVRRLLPRAVLGNLTWFGKAAAGQSPLSRTQQLGG